MDAPFCIRVNEASPFPLLLLFPVITAISLEYKYMPADSIPSCYRWHCVLFDCGPCCRRVISNKLPLSIRPILLYKDNLEICLFTGSNVKKGRSNGSLLVLFCPCFRKNVIVTCKIVSFCLAEMIFFISIGCFIER